MEPPSRCLWVPFGWAMRHELGSKAGLSPADISCYPRQVIEICSVILRFNKFLTIKLLTNTVKRSDSKICVSIRAMDRISRYRSATVGHDPHAILGWNELRLSGGRQSRARRAGLISRRGELGRCGKQGRATRHRQHAPSCCTCAPAMLAKPRF